MRRLRTRWRPTAVGLVSRGGARGLHLIILYPVIGNPALSRQPHTPGSPATQDNRAASSAVSARRAL